MSVNWVFVCAVVVATVPWGRAIAAPQPSRDKASASSLGKGGAARRAVRAKAKASKATRARSKAKTKARRRSRDRWPPMTLVDVNRRKNRVLKIRIYDRRGRARKQASAQMSRFLRCRRTGRRHRIHWRLIQNLYRVSRRFPGKRIHVYSGYRHRSVSRSAGSYHPKGRAIDFRVAGVGTRTLRDYLLKRFKRVGVGYYTKVPFVHLDVRARSAFWIDFSGSGEAPRYASNARRLLAREKRGIGITERRSAGDVATTARREANRVAALAAASAELAQLRRLRAFPRHRDVAQAGGAEIEDDLGDHVTGPAPLGPAPQVANRE